MNDASTSKYSPMPDGLAWKLISSGTVYDPEDKTPLATSEMYAYEIEGGGLLVKTLTMIYGPSLSQTQDSSPEPRFMSETLVTMEWACLEERNLEGKMFLVIAKIPREKEVSRRSPPKSKLASGKGNSAV